MVKSSTSKLDFREDVVNFKLFLDKVNHGFLFMKMKIRVICEPEFSYINVNESNFG